MLEEIDQSGRPVDEPQGFELLQELERNTPEEIRRQRAHFRIVLRSKVLLSPGNASEAMKFKWQGVTGDISQGGCKALFPMPIGVGDVYRLDFRQGPMGLSILFARCIRCREVREDAYEAGFRFFTPVSLSDVEAKSDTAATGETSNSAN
jgi:c-di-GMP-binding flagellar brake protein YcgR